MKCMVCGRAAPVLRRIDAPVALRWQGLARKLPRGALLCARHLQDYRGLPGAYVSAKEHVA